MCRGTGLSIQFQLQSRPEGENKGLPKPIKRLMNGLVCTTIEQNRNNRKERDVMSNHLKQETNVADNPEVLYEASSQIAVITLNRPERMNTISATMLDALGACFVRANADSRGSGRGSDRQRAGLLRRPRLDGTVQWRRRGTPQQRTGSDPSGSAERAADHPFRDGQAHHMRH